MKKLFLPAVFFFTLIFWRTQGDIFAQNINKPNIPAYRGLAVNSYTGSLFYQRTDLHISGRGLSLELTFYYNSSNTATDLGYGPGWTMTYSMTCVPDGSNAVIQWPDGRKDLYTWNGSMYVAPVGIFDILVQYLPGQYRLTTKSGIKFFFDNIAHHSLTKITDTNNNSILIAYTGSLPTLITDASGRNLMLSYTSGHLTHVSDPNFPGGRNIQYIYDSDRNPITVTDPLGGSYNYQYDGVRNMIRLTDQLSYNFNIGYQNCTYVANITSPLGSMNFGHNPTLLTTTMTQMVNSVLQSTSYKYNAIGNIIEKIGNCCGYHEQFSYDGMNNMIQKTDANGNVYNYTYDSKGNLLQETDPLSNTRIFVYEPVYNRVTSATDKRGFTTTYTYDANGNLTQINKPLGITELYTYDISGNQLTAKDGRGFITQYGYNSNGNITLITFPGGATNTSTYDNAGNQTSNTDANSNTTNYAYDAKNRLTQTTDAMGNITTHTYDARNNLLSFTDPLGHITSYAYDALMRKTGNTTPAGTSTFTYDEAGNMLTSTDNNGNTTQYAYDTRNLILSETDALGHTRSYTYDANGNKLSETDKKGNTTTYAYDALNRKVQMTNALLQNTAYSYDANGNTTAVTDANAHTTNYVYDALNRMTQRQRPIGTIIYAYDANDNRISITDANSHTTTTVYNNRNWASSVTDALGNLNTNSYDAQGNLISTTDPLGHTTTYSYDALNRQVTTTNPLSETTTVVYDADGRITSKTLPMGNTITYNYDAAHRPISAVDLIGTISSSTYDANSNMLTQTDGLGHMITYTYDVLNRVISLTDAMSKVSTNSYDFNSNLTMQTDRNGHATTYMYDALDRRIQSASPLGFNTSTAYDAMGNVLSMTDANSHATTYLYDVNDRRTRETFADGSMKNYTYDAKGNVISRTDNNGNITLYSYDFIDRLLMRDYPGINDDQFTYDAASRILTANNSNANISFTYDNTDRKLSENMNGHITVFSYDILNKKRFIIYPGGRNIEEDYDNRMRLSVIKEGVVPFVNSNYDVADRMTTRIYNNGTNTSYTYNNNNYITAVNHGGGPGIAQFIYGYDFEGNRLYAQKGHRPTNSESYIYDNDDRLTNYKEGTLVVPTVPAPLTQTQFNYDAVGNRTTVVKDAVISNYASNVVNKYTNIFDGVPIVPVYDANGNNLFDGTQNFGFDYENRQINVNGGAIALYKYDALGRRIQKVAAGNTINFYYDGNRVIEERNAADVVTATYINGSFGMDDVLNMKRGVNNFYYHQNSIGSVIAITNNLGNVVERYEYDAYGKPAIYNPAFGSIPATTIGNTYMFTGREYNAETGHYHYRARAYNPKWGRFNQWDPLRYVDGMNLYEYVRSNPVNMVDPTGMQCVIKPQGTKEVSNSWGYGKDKKYTGTGTTALFADASFMWGWYKITPTSNGGSAEIHAGYRHDYSMWSPHMSKHEVNVEWNRYYDCIPTDCIWELAAHRGPVGNPWKDYILFAHMKVDVTGEGTSKVHFVVEVKAGVSATVTVTNTFGAEGGVGGHEGKPGAKVTLGSSYSQTGEAGVIYGETLDWDIVCSKCATTVKSSSTTTGSSDNSLKNVVTPSKCDCPCTGENAKHPDRGGQTPK